MVMRLQVEIKRGKQQALPSCPFPYHADTSPQTHHDCPLRCSHCCTSHATSSITTVHAAMASLEPPACKGSLLGVLTSVSLAEASADTVSSADSSGANVRAVTNTMCACLMRRSGVSLLAEKMPMSPASTPVLLTTPHAQNAQVLPSEVS